MNWRPRIEISGFDAARLERFRSLQQQVRAVLQSTAATLRVGDSERAVAARLHDGFRALGVRHYFHVPVALFGERTAYPGDFGAFGALPTEKRLARDVPVILDAAPIIDGHVIDVSLPVVFGECEHHAPLMEHLQSLREAIPEAVRAGASFRQIAQDVDRLIRGWGLENCHRKHIGAVLGHRVTYAPDHWLARQRIWGLGAWHAAWFIGRSLAARRHGDAGSPNWNHGRESNHAPSDGLWAVEPHIARDGVGAKFEEILVIQDGQVYWLDQPMAAVQVAAES